MSEDLLIETATRVLADTCTPEALTDAERDGWAPGVWDALAGTGLPWVSVPESAGGSGGDLADALAVLRVAGAHAAPVPLAETSVLAGWLLASAGLAVGEGPLTVVPGRPGDDLTLRDGVLTGRAAGVPWAAAADRIVALVDGNVVVVRPSKAAITPSRNLAGEPRDTVTFDRAEVDELAVAPAGVDVVAFRRRGAVTRVVLIAGALDAMSRLANRYTAERRQFGQAVGRFQAVQALLVTAAEEATAVGLAADALVDALSVGDAAAPFETAAASTVAARGATLATRAAHQAHGAIGMTREYTLHHLTRRLWAWRAEYGEREWSLAVGRMAAGVAADDLYGLVQRGSSAFSDGSVPS